MVIFLLLHDVIPWVPARLANGLINSTRNRAWPPFLVDRSSSTVGCYFVAPAAVPVPAVDRYLLSGDSLAELLLASVMALLFLLATLCFIFWRGLWESCPPKPSSVARLTIPPSSETNYRGLTGSGRITSMRVFSMVVAIVLPSLRALSYVYVILIAGMMFARCSN